MEQGSSSNNGNPSTSSMNDLLCDEDASCLNDDHDGDDHDHDDDVVPSHQLLHSQLVHDDSVNVNAVDDDYIQSLVQKERNYMFYPSNYPPWVKDSRFLAINWILNTINSFGFQNHTAYLSVTYLDRFLSRRLFVEDQSWAIMLLAVACLSVAAKMEENRVPALSVYQVEDYAFHIKVIKEMEILVLVTLEWKMSLITPFVYINYFIKELGARDSNLGVLIPRVNELILALIRESNSIEDYRPFVVAAAAVVAAIDWQLTQDMLIMRIGTVTLWGTSNNKQQEEQQLIACYTIMQRLCSENNPGTPSVPEVYQSQNGNTPSLAGTKRSLSFRDGNQDPDLPN